MVEELVGRTIRKIQISADNTLLKLEISRGDLFYHKALYYLAQGDCCSVSWFNDVLGVDALLGYTVRIVEEVRDKIIYKEYPTLKTYGYKLTTDRGHAEIIFRNSSNGYYGGWLERIELDYLREDSPSRVGLSEITRDWSADARGRSWQ